MICSTTSLSLNKCHLISHVFERLGFMPEFTNPSVVKLSALKGVAVCLWYNAIKAGHMSIDVFLVFNVPHVSDSDDEDTTL